VLTGVTTIATPRQAAHGGANQESDDVQGFLFEQTRPAPTYPASMITRPFPSTPSTAKAKSRRWMKKTTDSKSRAL
jgi:hypothetical protein